jgi:hypothetical protein
MAIAMTIPTSAALDSRERIHGDGARGFQKKLAGRYARTGLVAPTKSQPR